MFGMSWGEIGIILVVAVIVIGPKDLPAVLRGAGKLAAKGKELVDEVKKAFAEALDEAEILETKNKIKTEMKKIVDLDGNLQDTYDISDIMPDIKKPDKE